jgi:pyridoxal phosphate enzyme (YggS family)
MSYTDNYLSLKNSLPANTQLIVVSKNQTVVAIEELYLAGQRDFGENKIQELWDKDQKTQHLPEIRWHMIGHIQTNKLKKLLSIKRLKEIHSIDREELLIALDKMQDHVASPDKIGLFWEINISKEVNKHGFESSEAVKNLLPKYVHFLKFYYHGLMCMGPNLDDEQLSQTQKVFASMKLIKNEWTHDKQIQKYFSKGLKISMGMSNDYRYAIQCGSDYLRLGSIIFK